MKQEEMDLDKYFAQHTKVSLQAAHQQQKIAPTKIEHISHYMAYGMIIVTLVSLIAGALASIT